MQSPLHNRFTVTATSSMWFSQPHSYFAHAGICSATTPFVLLGDVLDCLPLDLCDKIFSFVEENVSTWKSVKIKPQFYG